MKVQGARPQPLAELPRARQQRPDTSGNVQAQREDVTDEVIVVGYPYEVSGAVHRDGSRKQQHQSPESVRDPR